MMTLDPDAGTRERRASILSPFHKKSDETAGGEDNTFVSKIMHKLHDGVKNRVKQEAQEEISRIEEEDEDNDLYKIREVRDLTECRTSEQFLNLISH